MAGSQLCAVGVALTAEFTAVGDLFELVIGTVRWPIVIIIGIVSAIYTAYGGLYVSIVTDQVPQTCIPQLATPLPCCLPAHTASQGSLVLTLLESCAQQVQAGCAISIIVILVIWVAATFKAPLPKPMPSYLAATYTGKSNCTSCACFNVC